MAYSFLLDLDEDTKDERRTSAAYYTSTDQRGATRRGLEWLVATGVLPQDELLLLPNLCILGMSFTFEVKRK